MTSESPRFLDCPNGGSGSFAGPLVKSTYVKLTENALTFLVTHGVSSALSRRSADFSLMCIISGLPSNRKLSEKGQNSWYPRYRGPDSAVQELRRS